MLSEDESYLRTVQVEVVVTGIPSAEGAVQNVI